MSTTAAMGVGMPGMPGGDAPGDLTPIAQAVGHDAQVRRSRAAVALTLLMKPFTLAAVGIGSIFAMLWRMILRVLRKIAGIHKVDLDAPRDPLQSEPSSYVGEPGPAAQAGQVLRANGEFATQLSQSKNYQADLKGEGCVAYLKMALRRLGEDMKQADANLCGQREQLRAAAETIALRMNVTPKELVALLMRPQIGDATLSLDGGLPAARELAAQVMRTEEEVGRLKELFIDHCVCAIDPEIGDPGDEIDAIVRSALDWIGDKKLTDSVELALAELGRTGTVSTALADEKRVSASGNLRELDVDSAPEECGDSLANLVLKQNPSGLNSQNGFIEGNVSSVKPAPRPRRFGLNDVGSEACHIPALAERERAG